MILRTDRERSYNYEEYMEIYFASLSKRHSCVEIRNTARINNISTAGLSHANDRSDFPLSPSVLKITRDGNSER